LWASHARFDAPRERVIGKPAYALEGEERSSSRIASSVIAVKRQRQRGWLPSSGGGNTLRWLRLGVVVG
jgi:hypothetical protein